MFLSFCLNKDPSCLPCGKEKENNQSQHESKEDVVVLFADTVVYVFAVMIELLDAALALFAVIAICMNVDFADLAPGYKLFVFFFLLECRGFQTRVYRVTQKQQYVVVDDKDESEEVECHEE